MAAFIERFKPKNPLDADKQERIKKIIQRVLEAFGKNYALAVKDVLIEEAEKKQAKKEKKAAKKAAKGEKSEEEKPEPAPGAPPPSAEDLKKERDERERKAIEDMMSGKKPRRPRGPYTPETPNKDTISCKLTSYETLDSDVDPYVSYIFVASYKGMEATKSRRYKEFKDLHKKLGKLVPAGAVLPAASSKFGSRNLTHEFIEGRRKSLQEYIKKVCEVDGIAENEALRKFLGLVKSEDPRDDEIFDRALQQTKWDLWIWKKILYDEPGEALSKLIIEEIKRDMWSDICNACPPSERMRRTALKLAYRTISALVSPPVTAAWNAAFTASKEVRAKVVDTLGKAFDALVATKAEIKKKLKEGMTVALNPVTNILSKVLGGVLQALIPPILGAMQGTLSGAMAKVDQLSEALRSGNEEMLKELGNTFSDAKKEMTGKINEALQKAATAVIGDLGKEITLDALKDLLSPLQKFTNIIDSLGGIVDPKYWTEVTRHMLQYKEEIAKMDPEKDHERIERRLDHEEYDVMWWTWWWGYDIRSCGRNLWWELSTTLADLGPVPDVFWELSIQIQKKLHKRVLKRFSWKFGDYLWGAMHNSNDKRDWRTKCDEAFLMGYRCAAKCARKAASQILTEYACEFLKRPVLGAIQKHIVPQIENLLAPLQSSIPESLQSLLDINGLVVSVITESISDACDKIVLAQQPLFVAELAKVIGKPVSAITSGSSADAASSSATAAAPAPTATAVVEIAPVATTAPISETVPVAATEPMTEAAPFATTAPVSEIAIAQAIAAQPTEATIGN